METNKGEGAASNPQTHLRDQNPNPFPNPNATPIANPSSSGGCDSRTGGTKGKLCKGCLYYSSLQKSKSLPPTCVGLSTTLQEVPRYNVGESEFEATKEGRNLTDFRYACVGYSLFLEKEGQSSDMKDKQAELPFCVGLEVLLDKRTTPVENVPAHAHKNEDGHAFRQRQPYKPPNSTGDDYFNRFKRNASLVASGVARNVNRVGNYIKESLDDIFYPHRRRPK